MRVLLCVDDEPIRYEKLASKLKSLDILLVVTHIPRHVDFYIEHYRYEIIAVCLDHDMPINDGVEFANRVFCELGFKVLIVSGNPEGAKNIKKVLDDFFTPNQIVPATMKNWEDAIIDEVKSLMQHTH